MTPENEARAVEILAMALHRQSVRFSWQTWESSNQKESFRKGAQKLIAAIAPLIAA